MAYNPNPPFNPSDYGNRPGGLDYAAMEASLQNVRDHIASLGENKIVSDAKSNVADLLDRKPEDHSVAVGSWMGDKSEYKPTGNYSLPDYAQKALDQNTAYVNMYRQSLAGVADDYKNKQGQQNEVTKDKNKNKDKNKDNVSKDGLSLPDLDKEKTIKTKKDVTEMVKGSVQKKNPSFDGMDFQDFLNAAKAPQIQYIKGMEKETGNPANPELASLYNKLKDKGMTDDEMFKSAQYAGLTNVRTGKEGKKDFQQMLQTYENDFMVPRKTTKTETKTVNVGMDDARAAFGNQFKLKDYKAALDYENQDKKYIKNYLKDYAKRGGVIGDKVLALFPNIQ